jgi:poly(3-hydroxybutyrate) depolymerase
MMFADFRPSAPRAFAAIAAIAASVTAVPAMAETPNHCARYGADYVAVAGSNGCVKIGGHVRVDLARAPTQAMNYAATDGVQRAAHLQMGPFGLINDLLPR